MSNSYYIDPQYGSYAELIQKLLPNVLKLAFYNPQGVVQWISDGQDDPALRQFVRSVLLHRQQRKTEASPAAYVPNATQPIYLIPLCEPQGAVVSMLLLVCRPTANSSERVSASKLREQIQAVLDIVIYECSRYGRETLPPRSYAR